MVQKGELQEEFPRAGSMGFPSAAVVSSLLPLFIKSIDRLINAITRLIKRIILLLNGMNLCN